MSRSIEKKTGAAIISRRNFIAGAGVYPVVNPAIAPSSASAQKKPWLPSRWDKQADVVVLGFGGSGLVAAITAHDAGAKVLVLEKAPQGGGFTRASGCNLSNPTNPKDAADYLFACHGADVSMAICEATAEEMCKNKEWMNRMGFTEGVDYTVRLGRGDWKYPGQSSMASIITGSGASYPGGGTLWWAKLEQQVNKRGIEVLFDSPAVELIQNSDTKEIIGVRAVSQGKGIAVKARKAVVLCTGGFEFNDKMIMTFLRPYPMKFAGPKYNTGDGITMAQKVGAALWHMNSLCAYHCLWFPEYEVGFNSAFSRKPYSWIITDKYGRRYMNESKTKAHMAWTEMAEFDWNGPGFTAVPSYLIFDESKRVAGAIGAGRTYYLPPESGGVPNWSADNSEEIERGWILRGQTLRELAEKVRASKFNEAKMDPSVLEETVSSYNAYCNSGLDREQARNKSMLSPLSKPPYYAVNMWPGCLCTIGGPKRNEKCEIMDLDDKPIPRLFEAGTLGSIYGNVYGIFGGNIGGMVMAHGRIAGRNAAALASWD
jgi:hypothetical protein